MPLKLIFRDLEYSLENVRLRVGRAEQLDITISGDPLVSSQHCVITNGRLLDAQSTNGTQINKVKIAYGKPYVLKAGDVITIGETPLRIEEGIPYADRASSSPNPSSSTSSSSSSLSLPSSTSVSSASSLSSPSHNHHSFNSTQLLHTHHINNNHHHAHPHSLHHPSSHHGVDEEDDGTQGTDPSSTTSDSDSSDGDEDGDGDGDDTHVSPSMSGAGVPASGGPHDNDPLAWLPSYKQAQGPLSDSGSSKLKFDPFAIKRDAALAAAHAAAQAHNDQVSKIVRFSPASVDNDGTSKPLVDSDGRVTQYEEEIWELKRLLTQSENRCVQMKKKLSHQQRRQNVQQTKARMQKFEAQVQSLEYQMLYGDSKKDGEIDDLKDRLREASDELITLRAEHVHVLAKLATVEQQLAEANTQLTQYQQDLEQAQQQHTSQQQTLQQQCDTQQKQIQQHVTELCTLRDELSRERTSHQRELSTLTTQHQTAIDRYTTQHQEQQQQIHTLKAQHQVHKERTEQLTKELSSSQSEFRSTLSTAHKHEVAHQLAASQLARAEEEIAELKQQLKKQQKQGNGTGTTTTISREAEEKINTTLTQTQNKVKHLTIGLGCVVALQLAGFYSLAHGKLPWS